METEPNNVLNTAETEQNNCVTPMEVDKEQIVNGLPEVKATYTFNDEEYLEKEIAKVKADAKQVLDKLKPELSKCSIDADYLNGVVDDNLSNLMLQLRKLFSDPIDDKFRVKLSQKDFEDILWLGIDASVPKIVSTIILGYDHSKITEENFCFFTDAFWILTNISSGTTQTMSFIECGTVDYAMKIIVQCPHINLVNQCIMMISNVLMEAPLILNNVVNGPVYSKLQTVFPTSSMDTKSHVLQMYFSIVKTKSDICSIKAECMIHQAASVLSDDTPIAILKPAMNFFNEVTKLTDKSPRYIDLFVRFAYVPKLTSFISHSDESVRNRCLMTVGNLVLGDDSQTWHIMKNSLMQHLVCTNYATCLELVKHTLWTLSNVAASESKISEVIFELEFLPAVFHYISCNDGELAYESLWLLSNLLKFSTPEQIQKYLLNDTVIKTLERVFLSDIESMQPSTASEKQYLNLATEMLHSLLRTTDDMNDELKQDMIHLLKSSKLQVALEQLDENDEIRLLYYVLELLKRIVTSG